MIDSDVWLKMAAGVYPYYFGLIFLDSGTKVADASSSSSIFIYSHRFRPHTHVKHLTQIELGLWTFKNQETDGFFSFFK